MHHPLHILPQTELLVGGITSLVVCLVIVLTQRWHGRFTHDGATGVQKFHQHPTPRVGGIALMAGLPAAVYVAPPVVQDVLWPMLLASLPAFVFGLIEDTTKQVSVRTRLLATMASGVLAWYLTGISLNHVDVWGADWLLQWVPLSVLFTAFAVGGVANSINIIDGMNGLASGVVMVALSSLGWMSYMSNDIVMAKVCFVLFGVTAGFWLVNFPWGRIFLGDGGAYLLGFLLAWVAILVPMRNPDVSPWASLLACSYPVLEVGFTVARRLRRQLHPGHPDRLHLHSLIKRRISRKVFPQWARTYQNASVSPLVWLLAAVPGTLAVVFRTQPLALFVALCACALGYQMFYWRLVWFGRQK